MFFFSPEATEVIARAQQADLEREEARLKEEQAARKALRLQRQSSANQMNASELLERLVGQHESVAQDKPFHTSEGEAHEPAPTKSRFPAPPTKPKDSSSS